MVQENPWKTSEPAVSHCILSDRPSFRQCTVSSFAPSTFLPSKGPCCAGCFSEATCNYSTFSKSSTASSCISCCKEEQVHGGKSDWSATILEILHTLNQRRGKLLHQKSLWELLIKTKNEGREFERNRDWPCSLFAETQRSFHSILWICGLQQAFGWLLISRPSSDLWGWIGTTARRTTTT